MQSPKDNDMMSAIPTFISNYSDTATGVVHSIKIVTWVYRSKVLAKIMGVVGNIFFPRRAENLLQKRENLSQRLLVQYAGETSLLAIGEQIRVAYSHVCILFSGKNGTAFFESLSANSAPDFSLDNSIGVDGLKDAVHKFRLAQGSRDPFPGSTVRVSGWDSINGILQLAKSDYIDQFTSCQIEIVDTPLGEISSASDSLVIPDRLLQKSFRSLASSDGKLNSFENSPLANTIGIASSVVTCDGWLVLPRRNRRVHYQQGYEGCSISGVLEWSDALLSNPLLEICNQLRGKEGPQEIVLSMVEGPLVPLAFARELERAGKPQFFCHTWTNMTLADFQERWSRSQYVTDENDSIRAVQLFEPGTLACADGRSKAASQMTERLFILLQPKTVLNIDNTSIVLSEEARASLFYLAWYMSSKKEDGLPREWS